MLRTFRISSTAALLLLLAACAPPGRMPALGGADARAEIVALLEASTAEWNRGNLEGFLLPYLDGDETTFVGSRGLIRGKNAIRDTYRASYFQGGVPKGQLAFRDIEVRALSAGHALAIGRYVVTDRTSAAEPATGIFSLVLRRTGDGWRIVHDHSS